MRGMSVLRPLPAPRKRPASSGLPIVADSPMRLGRQSASLHMRSIRQNVCMPRSPRSSEWTSSMTMKRRSPNSEGISICLLIISDSSDSGVICKMPEGLRSSLRFWA